MGKEEELDWASMSRERKGTQHLELVLKMRITLGLILLEHTHMASEIFQKGFIDTPC